MEQLNNTGSISLLTGARYPILVNATVTGPNMQYDPFLNGTNIAISTSGGVNAVSGPLLFGHTASILGASEIWPNPLRGSLDQVAFWDRTLTPAEVAAMNNGGQGFSFPSTSVPEPSALALLILAMLLVFSRRLPAVSRIKR